MTQPIPAARPSTAAPQAHPELDLPMRYEHPAFAPENAHFVVNKFGGTIARCFWASAAHDIVRACNSHAALVAALRLARDALHYLPDVIDASHHENAERIVGICDTAIEEATGIAQ